MKVKNWLNAHEFITEGEVNNQPSMTIPDQSMGIKEILSRFAKGLPISGQRMPQFDENDDMPDFRTLDLAERQEMAENFREELNEIRSNDSKRKAAYKVYIDAKAKEEGKPSDPNTNVP